MVQNFQKYNSINMLTVKCYKEIKGERNIDSLYTTVICETHINICK